MGQNLGILGLRRTQITHVETLKGSIISQYGFSGKHASNCMASDALSPRFLVRILGSPVESCSHGLKYVCVTWVSVHSIILSLQLNLRLPSSASLVKSKLT